MHKAAEHWDKVSRRSSPSWYLDPLVAEQKRRVHQELIRQWTDGRRVKVVLKTDVFEEAFGEDYILFDLFPEPYGIIGIDVAEATTRQASRRRSAVNGWFLTTDVRRLALRANAADLIISNSTLDHFDSREEFRQALRELARALEPGGLLIITMDNPHNPLYRLLRWLTRFKLGPFLLGYTTSERELARELEECGLEIVATKLVLHNPRLISTLLFLALRRLMGRAADRPIRGLLGAFAALDKLPTRQFTACFVGASARKAAR